MLAAPLYLLILLTGLNPSNLRAGIKQLSVLVSPKGMHQVVLAGDVHDRNPKSQTERLAREIALRHKTNPIPLEVYVEKPAIPFQRPESKHILTTLDQKLSKFNLKELKTINCEIRNVSLLAYWLFWDENPEEKILFDDFISAGKKCSVHHASFADLDAEFIDLHTSLLKFSDTLETEFQECFKQELSSAEIEMKDFTDQIKEFITKSKTILDAAIQLYRFDRAHGSQNKKERMKNAILQPFSRLFDLNMMRLIFCAQHKCTQLFLCGAAHTRHVQQLLMEMNWKIDSHPKAVQDSDNVKDINFEILNELRVFPEE